MMFFAFAAAAAQPFSPEVRAVLIQNICKPAFNSNGVMKLDDFIPPKFSPTDKAKVRRVCAEYLQEQSRAQER